MTIEPMKIFCAQTRYTITMVACIVTIVDQWRNMAAAARCVKTLYFSLWKNSLKFKMLWFFESKHHHLIESIATIAHFYILTLPGGRGGGAKKSRKIHFSRGCREKMAITQKILRLAP